MAVSTQKIKQEEQIDLFNIAKRLWIQRFLFYKILGLALFIGLIIAFSIPKEYIVTVTLAPESSRKTSSSLASMAAMMGLGNLASGGDNDALNVLLYPNILASTPFALDLYNMPVHPMDTQQSLALNEYVETLKQPWWTIAIGFPKKVVSKLLSALKKNKDEGKNEEKTLNPFQLTPGETNKLWAIKSALKVDIDKKTGVTTIAVTMQDPMVAATVADSVIIKLQNYVTTYRTKKAVVDYVYWEKLYKEKQENYYIAQQKYAIYLDENKNLYTQKSKIEGERLQNEMNLAYEIYNQTAAQLQMAQGKLQEAKPVFAVVEPATVPLRPSSPRKMVIIIGCLFLAFVGTAGWILFGEDIWKKMKETMKTNSITTD